MFRGPAIVFDPYHSKKSIFLKFCWCMLKKNFQKSIFLDFFKYALNHVQASHMDQKRVLNTLRVILVQFSMIYTSFKQILRKSIFCKKWIFCDFSAKFYFQKITVLVTKRHKKSRNFFELKSMDHKLSNDVFGMFVRFLVQVLW